MLINNIIKCRWKENYKHNYIYRYHMSSSLFLLAQWLIRIGITKSKQDSKLIRNVITDKHNWKCKYIILCQTKLATEYVIVARWLSKVCYFTEYLLSSRRQTILSLNLFLTLVNIEIMSNLTRFIMILLSYRYICIHLLSKVIFQITFSHTCT